jgi:beta-galactosidase/beta-glucuronidase
MYFLPFKFRIMKFPLILKYGLGVMSLILLSACSHNFDSNVLDLNFYQWNLWHDQESALEDEAPSCGWEVLHRGNGKLVRIPALIKDQFPGETGTGIYWYHCRFTLPEDWKESEVAFRFEGVGPIMEVYLNGDPIGSKLANEVDFEIDVSEVIYYTRDNHLALRVIVLDDTQTDSAGIAGTVLAKSKKAP